MAMLAEPRRRKRYNLQSRGKPLYEEENHFGRKMLEKMGWSLGKGLGPKENGIKEFLKISYKNDAQGLGYEERDDQWTEHEKYFTNLLQVLNEKNSIDIDHITKKNIEKETKQRVSDSERNDIITATASSLKSSQKENATQNEFKQKFKEQISGTSLEEISKQSKVRVHYKKYTKGKDISQYSEKDLANIFGKREIELYSNNNFMNSQTTSYSSSNNNNDCKKMDENLKFHSDTACNSQTMPNKLIMEMNQHDKMDTNVITTNDDLINTNVVKKRKKNRTIETTNNNCNGNVIQTVSNAIQMPNDNNKINEFKEVDCSVASINETNINKKTKKKKKEGQLKNKIEDVKEGSLPSINKVNGEMLLTNKELKGNKTNKERAGTPSLLSIENKDKGNNSKHQDSLHDTNNNISIIQKYDENRNSIEIKDQELNEAVNIEKLSGKQKKQKKQKKEKNEKGIFTTEMNKTKLSKEQIISTAKQKFEDPGQSLIFLNEESTAKKRKLINTKDKLDMSPAIEDKAEYVLSQSSDCKKKKKKHKTEVTIDLTSNIPNTVEIQEQESLSLHSLINNNETNNSSPTLEELKAKYDAFKVFTISSFCAEKFRNVDVQLFSGASLIKVNGYSLNDETQLNVKYVENDEERITNLWKSILDKYEGLEKPKKTYSKYMKEAYKARIHKQKRPKLHVKSWKRKNVFCAL